MLRLLRRLWCRLAGHRPEVRTRVFDHWCFVCGKAHGSKSRWLQCVRCGSRLSEAQVVVSRHPFGAEQ